MATRTLRGSSHGVAQRRVAVPLSINPAIGMARSDILRGTAGPHQPIAKLERRIEGHRQKQEGANDQYPACFVFQLALPPSFQSTSRLHPKAYVDPLLYWPAGLDGFQSSMSRAAAKAMRAPKKKGAEGLIVCHSRPAMSDAGKSRRPKAAL